VITLVAAGLPGERVFDLSRRDYRALRPGEVIVAANGQQVSSARQFAELVKQSPQVMRLRVDNQGRAGEVLLRLRY
jgi:S1-C subfamily serine protease